MITYQKVDEPMLMSIRGESNSMFICSTLDNNILLPSETLSFPNAITYFYLVHLLLDKITFAMITINENFVQTSYWNI